MVEALNKLADQFGLDENTRKRLMEEESAESRAAAAGSSATFPASNSFNASNASSASDAAEAAEATDSAGATDARDACDERIARPIADPISRPPPSPGRLEREVTAILPPPAPSSPSPSIPFAAGRPPPLPTPPSVAPGRYGADASTRPVSPLAGADSSEASRAPTAALASPRGTTAVAVIDPALAPAAAPAPIPVPVPAVALDWRPSAAPARPEGSEADRENETRFVNLPVSPDAAPAPPRVDTHSIPYDDASLSVSGRKGKASRCPCVRTRGGLIIRALAVILLAGLALVAWRFWQNRPDVPLRTVDENNKPVPTPAVKSFAP